MTHKRNQIKFNFYQFFFKKDIKTEYINNFIDNDLNKFCINSRNVKWCIEDEANIKEMPKYKILHVSLLMHVFHKFGIANLVSLTKYSCFLLNDAIYLFGS